MKYNLKKQINTYFCMPSCLQAILLNKSIELDQEKVASEIKCTKQGVLDLNYVKIFLLKYKLSFNYFEYNKVSFNEYDFLLDNEQADILIARPNSKGFHVYLLEEFRDPQLFIIDPKDAEIQLINLYNLIEEMHQKEGGGFGLVEKLNY